MKQWDKINWSAMNRCVRKIEVDLRQWWPEQDALKEKGVATPSTQAERATAQALMVWADDGGSLVQPFA